MLKKTYDSIKREDLESLTKDELYSLFSALYNDNVRLTEENKKKDALLATVNELKNLANLRDYGPSTEQVAYLFPELETLIKYESQEPQTIVPGLKKDKQRKPREAALKLSKATPVITVDHTKDSPDTITQDNIIYKRTEDKVILKVSYTPSKKVIEAHHYAAYKATVEVENKEQSSIIQFQDPEIDTCALAPAMLSHIAVSKFDDHLPLYRQEEIFKREGLPIARQLMSRTLSKYYSSLVKFEKFFSKQIFKSNAICQDETPVEVISVKSASGKVSSSSFVIIRIGLTYNQSDGKFHKLVNMQYSTGRSKDALFEGFGQRSYPGFLMTDGLKGYYDAAYFQQERHASCWVHAIRKMKEYAKLNKDNKHAFEFISMFNELYLVENKFREKLAKGLISPTEFLSQRKEAATSVIDSIIGKADSLTDYTTGTDAFSKAINYFKNYRDTLYNYLDCVELTPDNNEAERIAKAFATGRKNWLFAQTVDGIDTSCFLFSLIESAKCCGLNPEKYVEYILTYGPYTKEEDFASLLPWNADLNKIDDLYSKRDAATADKDRTKDYILTGFSR